MARVAYAHIRLSLSVNTQLLSLFNLLELKVTKHLAIYRTWLLIFY